ncbi:MATE family efflux transporter [Clostridium sp.]|uniref:MATE family efflux transporter n=1 Tax=Clostridium sp. TaxID=1506 RepID=UPI0032175D89
MNKNNVLENKSISKLIFIFAIPSICSLLLESVASMIDTVFAGHLGAISANALTAMGILNPILSLLIAAQLVFGVSTSIVIAKGLGEDNKGKVNNAFKVGLYSSFIFSFTISLIIFIFQGKLLDILGANGQVRRLAKEYLNIAIIFNIFSSTGYTLVNNIRAFGYPKIEIMVVVSATAINVLFNTIFTFGMDMGIRGIALATLISEIYYLSSSAIFLMKKNLWIKKSTLSVNEVKSILLSLVKIGFVQFLMQALSSLTAFIINNRLMTYASIIYIGVWAICSNIHTVIILPLIGLTQGIQSIIAYYQGSKDENRKNEAKMKAIKYSLIYSISATILVGLFADKFVSIFTPNLDFINLAIPIVRIMFLGFPFMGVVYTLITFMQVSDNEKNAIILGMTRQMGVFIPLVIILPIIFSKYNIMNIPPGMSIFIAIPLSDVGAFIVGIYLSRRCI